jgi:hypothetical protein
MKCLSCPVATIADDDLDVVDLWKFLKDEYGENDPYFLKKELKAIKMVGIDLFTALTQRLLTNTYTK